MPRTPPPPAALLEFLRPYHRAIQELALEIRSVVLDELMPCHENIYDAYNAVAIGYGSSDRLRDCICHIAVYTRHVNLGFNRGTLLEDPDRILHGTGKWTRHVTLKSADDVARPAIRMYLRRAKELAGAGTLDSATAGGGVKSAVKKIYPRRRRPGGIVSRG